MLALFRYGPVRNLLVAASFTLPERKHVGRARCSLIDCAVRRDNLAAADRTRAPAYAHPADVQHNIFFFVCHPTPLLTRIHSNKSLTAKNAKKERKEHKASIFAAFAILYFASLAVK
jgi:hypothetical protein